MTGKYNKKIERPKCSICGRFMRRIGLIARIRYATGEYIHHK